jgi:hypothetical protein
MLHYEYARQVHALELNLFACCPSGFGITSRENGQLENVASLSPANLCHMVEIGQWFPIRRSALSR